MHPREDFTLTRLFRIDGCIAAQITRGTSEGIQPHEILFLRIRPVTDKTFIGKDGQNFP